MNYFLLRLFTFLCCCMNKFFIRTTNYFLVVLRIIFNASIENYFFHRTDNYFSRYHEFIFRPTMLCGPCSWSGLIRVFDFLGRPFWKLWSYKICQEPVVYMCVSDEVFWTKDLIDRGDYEATSRLVHNSNRYWTWHVCPIEQFSTQSYTSSLSPVLHMLALGTKMLWIKVPPYPELQEGSPDSKIMTSGHKN